MASIIDAFVVTFGLDPKKFRDGAKKVVDAQEGIDEAVDSTNDNERRVDRERTERNKKSADGYRKIRTEVLGLFAIFTAGRSIKNFIGETVDEAANLGYLSDNLRTSTEDLTAWQRASERAGGSAAGITAQFQQSADTLSQLKSGMGPTQDLQWFFRLGGSSDDLKDGNSYLLARSKIINEMFQTDPMKASLMARNLGIAEDQFNFIKQGPEAINALVNAQRKNAVIAREDADAALTLKNNWLDLSQSLQATAVKLLVALMPAFAKIVEGVGELTKYLTDNKDVVAGWGKAFVEFDWNGLAAKLRGVAADVRGVTGDIKDLRDTWASWTGDTKNNPSGIPVVGRILNEDGKIPSTLSGISDVVGRNTITKDTVTNDRAERAATMTKAPDGSALPGMMSTVKEMWYRTLASMGNKQAKEYIRDVTGKDDYNVGPKAAQPAAPAPKVTPAPAATPVQTETRGLRNKNPGNIEYGPFARAQGAIGVEKKGGRFAQFESHQDGLNAMGELLRSYGRQGINSIDGILKKYAPASENDTGKYASYVSKESGISRDVKIDLSDPRILQPIMAAMVKYENSGKAPYNPDMIRRAAGNTPAAVVTQAQATSAVARNPSSAPTRQTSTTTVTNNIEKIEITTKATDASGIARDIRPELGKISFPNQASTGVRQ